METEVKLEIDLEEFRYSLVGDGYLLSEVKVMSEEKLVSILNCRIYDHIEREYRRSKELGLLDGNR